MSEPKRIVVVDDDPKVRQLLEYKLRAPQFEFHGFSDGRDALMHLHDILPDLIVSDVIMPDMDGRIFFRVVKRSERLRDVPFIFLSALRADADIMAALDAGAEAFLQKPFPVSQLVAKIRARLGVAEPTEEQAHEARTSEAVSFRETPREERRPAASRPVPSLPPLPPPRAAAGSTPVEAGAPAAPGEDFFSMLLAETKSPEAPSAAPAAPPALKNFKALMREAPLSSSGQESAPAVEGRFSSIEIEGQNIQILTEGGGLPNFTVTTVIARNGEGVRKIETAWQHPLQRTEDLEVARRQVDLQHERAVATVHELIEEGRPRSVIWGSHGKSVDGALLAWAVSFVAEQARAYIGSAIALTLLRQTFNRVARDRDILRSFRVREDGRVACNRPQLQQSAVDAVAVWLVTFLTEAAMIAERVKGLRIRQVTRMMADDLERIGFYTALEAAARTPVRPKAQLGVPKRVATKGPSQPDSR